MAKKTPKMEQRVGPSSGRLISASPIQVTQRNGTIGGLRIEDIPIDKIHPAEYNPRTLLKPGDKGYAQLEASLDRFGLTEPLVWNERTGNLVAGHQRLEILRAKGAQTVPVSVVDLTEENERALNLAMNHSTGEFDKHKLQEVLSEFTDPGLLDVTGFTVVDLAQLNAELASMAEFADSMETEEPFEPTLEPKVARSNVTAKQVEAAEKKQGEKFQTKREPKDITCPHCGQVFGIGGWLQEYVEETEQLQEAAKS